MAQFLHISKCLHLLLFPLKIRTEPYTPIRVSPSVSSPNLYFLPSVSSLLFSFHAHEYNSLPYLYLPYSIFSLRSPVNSILSPFFLHLSFHLPSCPKFPLLPLSYHLHLHPPYPFVPGSYGWETELSHALHSPSTPFTPNYGNSGTLCAGVKWLDLIPFVAPCLPYFFVSLISTSALILLTR